MNISISLEDIIAALRTIHKNDGSISIEKLFIIEEVIKRKKIFDVNITLYDFDELLKRYDKYLLINEHDLIFCPEFNNKLEEKYVKSFIYFDQLVQTIKLFEDHPFKRISDAESGDSLFIYRNGEVTHELIDKVVRSPKKEIINGETVLIRASSDEWVVYFSNCTKKFSIFCDNDIILNNGEVATFDIERLNPYIKHIKFSRIITLRKEVELCNLNILKYQEDRKDAENEIKKNIF